MTKDANEVRARLEQAAQDLRSVAARHAGLAEGDDLLDREVELAIEAGVDADRRAVVDALARLEAGTYGRCEACGDPIAEARLEAVPATRFCLAHEVEAETRLGATSADAADSRDPAELVRVEAQHHLDGMNDDDDGPEEDLEPGAEDQAIHIRRV